MKIKTAWLKSITLALGLEWEEASSVVVEKVLDRQTVIYMSKESPRCNDGWNFATHGVDWECKCSEGSEQSPINLPDSSDLENVEA